MDRYNYIAICGIKYMIILNVKNLLLGTSSINFPVEIETFLVMKVTVTKFDSLFKIDWTKLLYVG